MLASLMLHFTLASGKVRLVQKLIDGDPVAWSIVGGGIAIVVLIAVGSKMWGKGNPAERDPIDDVRHISQEDDPKRPT